MTPEPNNPFWRPVWLAAGLVMATLLTPGQRAAAADQARLSDFVCPFVGAKGEGNTFPGPSAPFGMIQISPDTDTTNWDTDGGYEYNDPTIQGFSLTHLSGTGCPDLGDFLFMPQVGEPALVVGEKDHPENGYQSAFKHEEESATAGYYQVRLQKSGVKVELTAGERAGMLRFTFPASAEASILTDLSHVISGGRWRVAQSRLRIEDNATVTGFHLVNGWAKERYLYFAARYSRPFGQAQIVSNGKPVKYTSYVNYRFRSQQEAAGTNLQFLARYRTGANEVILVKVGISAVSTANALENLDTEIPDWDFAKLQAKTRQRWDDELSRIQITGTEEQKKTFYTSLYHALLVPNLYQDVNGQYRGFDQNIHTAKNFTKYSVFSLWDTFRAEHPLLALIQAPRDADMINSMLAHFDQSADHLLPMWELQGNETWCMIGYHAAPVIADGYLKGVKGFDAERAYAAIKKTAMNPDYDGLNAYRHLGWVPCDQEDESLSKTLEYAYDDFSIAQMAKALGKKDDYEYFLHRAANYRNIYDANIGWMHSRNANGSWRTNFDAHLFYGGTNLQDVTEGTSSQYSWFVPQDVPGLIDLMGGKAAFAAKLDSLFDAKQSEKFQKELSANDLRGCLGEYWHGNEPAHHVIYLYCYAGQPWKAAERLHQIVTSQYGSGPGSLCGNDDCGQMSSWYMFTCLGFYPVCPAAPYYVIGAPQLPSLTMHLSNGREIRMTAENISEQNIYVQSLKVNGKAWNSPFLPFTEVKNGGRLEFVMGPQPNYSWGTNTDLLATLTPSLPVPSLTVSHLTADQHSQFEVDATAAPELANWAETELSPALIAWYPKIAAALSSSGYTAPAHFKITLRPMDGVAYTMGTDVHASRAWLDHELDDEAVGSLIHEAVHVVQQYKDYNGKNPGWLVEGIADYVRWFQYEPGSHGADNVWLHRHGKNFHPKYNDSYRVTANFLDWVTQHYDRNVVKEMNAAMREGNYSEELWVKYTGKRVQDLGTEWLQQLGL